MQNWGLRLALVALLIVGGVSTSLSRNGADRDGELGGTSYREKARWELSERRGQVQPEAVEIGNEVDLGASRKSSSSLFNLFTSLLQNVQVTISGERIGSSGSDNPSDPSDSGSGDTASYRQCMADSQSDSYNTQCMLTALADEVIIPNYNTLASKAQDFAASDGALRAYCSAITTTNEGDALADAQLAWKDLSTSVQKAEMHAFGPAAENGFALQYRLSSYMSGPISSCGVDSIAALSDDLDVTGRALNSRGMGAVEYLLFKSDLNHTCPPQAASTQDWNDLADDARKAARCEGASLIADDIADAATRLSNAWSANGNDYRGQFLDDSNINQSLQAVTDGIFYLEKGTKDAKLGKPLGLITACATLTCPDQIEAPFSSNSIANMITNIQAFENIFISNDETGFDAHIENERFPEVSERFVRNLAAAKAFALSIDGSLSNQVAAIKTEAEATECTNAAANPDTASENFPGCTLYGLMKRIIDDLKIDFVTIVDVAVPGSSQSDND